MKSAINSKPLKSQLFLLGSLIFAFSSILIRNNQLVLFSVLCCFIYISIGALRCQKILLVPAAFCILLPCVIGFTSIDNASVVDIFRDFIFFFIPFVFFMAGINFRNENGDIEALIVKTMFIYAILFLIFVGYQFAANGYLDRQLIRDNVSYGSFLSLLGMYIIFFNSRRWWHGFSKAYFFIFPFVFFLESSRTYAIMFILFITIYIYKQWRMRALLLFAFIALVCCMVFLPFDIDELVNVYFYKLVGEVMSADAWTKDSIVTNYRAYETEMGLKMYNQMSLAGMIFGQGFGSYIPLDFKVLLGETEYDAIPLTHNGYVYLLIKTGLLGLFCFALFFTNLLLRSVRLRSTRHNVGFVGILIGLLLANWVICGFFNIQSAVAYVFLGYQYQFGLNSTLFRRTTSTPTESLN